MITACVTGSPRYSSATRFISRTITPMISGQVNVLPAISRRASSFSPRTILKGHRLIAFWTSGESNRRPIKRLAAYSVFDRGS